MLKLTGRAVSYRSKEGHCSDTVLAVSGQAVALELQEKQHLLEGWAWVVLSGVVWEGPGHPGWGHRPCSALLCKVSRGWGLGTRKTQRELGWNGKKRPVPKLYSSVSACLMVLSSSLSFLNPRLESFGLPLPCGHRNFLLSCKRMA